LGVGEGANNKLGASALISAVAFARRRTSIWKALAPTTDIFVRRMNAGYDRFFRPLQSETLPERRGILNEASFKLFAEFSIAEGGDRSPPREVVLDAIQAVEITNARLHGAVSAEKIEPTEMEIKEVQYLYRRLFHFFLIIAEGNTIEFYPKFVGCGILDTSAGDVYFSGKLFEIKAGDRRFLSVDVRQLLVYAALNKASAAREITHLGLFNPRAGISFLIGIDELCMEISGRPSSELLAEIIRIASSDDISR
jgi:hypothetical protein